MKTDIKFTVFLFFFGFQALGQTNRIFGILTDANTSEPIPFAILVLTTVDAKEVKKTSSGMDGHFLFDSLIAKKYLVAASFVSYQDTIVALTDLGDTLRIKMSTCIVPYRPCPICFKKDKVITIEKDLVVHYSFPSKRKEEKYYKQVKRQGYIIHESNGKRVLTKIADKNSMDLIEACSPCCKLLFCERDNKIF